jgi:GLPGLI family protein
MKRILFLLLVAFFTTSLTAQNVGGTATYKTAGKLNFEMDFDQMSPDQRKMIEARMAKAMQKEFTLNFNRNESLYEEVVEMEKEGQRGMRFLAMMTGGTGTYYKNLKEERYTEATEFFGKPFLIKDSLVQLEWKIEKETKSIGNYICQKATAMRIREVSQITANSGEGFTDSVMVDTVFITAWFTMQIPVSHGPGQYFGLPGLILELNDGMNTILCTKVSLNTNTETEIKEPNDGEEVSSEEFEEITQKKLEEMQQNFGNGQRGRGGNRSFQITIGR